MTTALIAATTSASTSSDVVISAGTTVLFTLIGVLDGNDYIAIEKKDSAGAYRMISEEFANGKIRESSINNSYACRTISNNTSSTITVRVVKPASTIATGVDQD